MLHCEAGTKWGLACQCGGFYEICQFLGWLVGRAQASPGNMHGLSLGSLTGRAASGNIDVRFVAAAEVKTDRLGQKPDDAGVSIQVK